MINELDWREIREAELVTSKPVDPNGSLWVVAVDLYGAVHVLKSPDFNHDGRYGETAEELFDTDISEDDPGVYEWVCNLATYTDVENEKFWHFFPVEKTKLYTLVA